MDSERIKRKKDIQKALAFIESPSYPDTDFCMGFESQLVFNLLVEGNNSFKETACAQAVKEFSQGLGVVRHAAAKGVDIPEALVESLYVNRATVHYSMGEFELGVLDCEQALEGNQESSKALYRKALCLKELGRHQEAYDCTTSCLLITRLDKQVNELAQELAVSLGLKNRKAYIPARQGNGLGNGWTPPHGTANFAPSMLLSSAPKTNSPMTLGDLLHGPSKPRASPTRVPPVATPPVATPPAATPPPGPDPDTLEDFELMGEDLDSLLDRHRNEAGSTETCIHSGFPAAFPAGFPAPPTCSAHLEPPNGRLSHASSARLPAPSPLLPPAFFGSALRRLNAMDTLSGGPPPAAEALAHVLPSRDAMDSLDTLDSFTPAARVERGVAGRKVRRKAGPAAAHLTEPLDTLDSLDQMDNRDQLEAPDKLDSLDTPDKLDLLETRYRLNSMEPPINMDLLETRYRLNSMEPPINMDLLETLDQPDSLDDIETVQSIRAFDEAENTCLDGSLDCVLDSLQGVASMEFLGGGHTPKAVGNLKTLDVLDSFSTVEKGRRKSGVKASHNNTPPARPSPTKGHKRIKASNPLDSTHLFLQACSVCFPRQARSVYSYVHKPDVVHDCHQDILLCRRRTDPDPAWTRVRPMPNTKPFTGKFVLCRELLNSGEVGLCKYGEMCTFAFNQLEIDVWTEERKGTLDRAQLFDTPRLTGGPAARVVQLLEEHKGMFMFLCEKCYNAKPSIISKRCRDDGACSNARARHVFDANKCLVYVSGPSSVSYRKVRPFTSAFCLELCRHAARYGCQMEDSCMFAHSPVELKTWTLQHDTGLTAEEIVDKSVKYCGERDPPANWKNPLPHKVVGGDVSKPKGAGSQGLNLRLRFICARCWHHGLITEPDKALKYCTAKGRHSWTKDGRVLLVMSPDRNKWVQVRQLPFAKNYPVQYDICAHILKNRKCNYTGNCTFAHSQEEKDLWTYMKNNDLKDIQQIYEVWLLVARQDRQKQNGSADGQPRAPGDDKYIVMPTDFAEPMSGFYCHLCGRHSNSMRQWQQHIATEKHKDRVLGCEGEDHSLPWSYRFPGPRFELCPKLDSECAEGVCCDYAHSPEELQEWLERRSYLRRRLATAREEQLILPGDFEFGKFNFLLLD